MGVPSVFERATLWVRKARAELESWRRRREARRLVREAFPGTRAAVARTWIEAEVAARLAVRSGVRADDYLRARLARYASALPMPLEALGIAVTFENGEPVIRSRGHAPAAPSPGPLSGIAREAEEARAEVKALGERVATARSRLDALLHAVSQELATGKLAGDPSLLDASPEQRGRPPVPPLAPQLLLGGLTVALLASAAFRMAAPAFALAGLSPEALAADLAQDPVSTIAALLFGFGAAVAVFALLHVAADRGRELLVATPPARRHVALLIAGGAATALAAVVALAAAHPGALAGPLLLVTVPLGAVFLARQASQLAQARAAALATALAWDREQALGAGERARRAEAMARLEGALASDTRELDAAEERLRALEQQAAEEAREASALASRAALSGERLAESLAAALELDRYAFLRRAAALARAAPGVRPLRTRPSPVDPPTVRGPLEAAG